MLVHVNFSEPLFVIFLNAHKQIVGAFLQGYCKPVRQIYIDLVAHVLREHGRVLLKSCLKLAFLSCMDLILVIADRELVVEVFVHALQSELFLVDVGLGNECEIHIGHVEGAHAPLFDNMARLSLKPLIEVKHH